MKKMFNIETLATLLENKEMRQEFEQEKLVLDFTQELAKIKESLGLSNKEFANVLGYSPSYVTQLLSGEKNISLRTAARIMFKLGRALEFSVVPVGSVNRFQFFENNDWEADIKSMRVMIKPTLTESRFVPMSVKPGQGWRSTLHSDSFLISWKGQGDK